MSKIVLKLSEMEFSLLEEALCGITGAPTSSSFSEVRSHRELPEVAYFQDLVKSVGSGPAKRTLLGVVQEKLRGALVEFLVPGHVAGGPVVEPVLPSVSDRPLNES